MGLVLSFPAYLVGRVTEEQPAFEVLGQVGDVQIRRYAPLYMATFRASPDGEAQDDKAFRGDAFRALAKYIGVIGKPQNRTSEEGADDSAPGAEAIAMTAPVVMTGNKKSNQRESEAIAMTAPVVMSATSGQSMSFVLPSKFLKEGRAPPAPLDARITIEKQPERTLGVKQFSYSLTHARAERHAMRAVESLRAGCSTFDVVVDGQGNPVWEFAGYNPPFTLPCLKTNEALVLLAPKPGPGEPTPAAAVDAV